jgi:hypothetical protein
MRRYKITFDVFEQGEWQPGFHNFTINSEEDAVTVGLEAIDKYDEYLKEQEEIAAKAGLEWKDPRRDRAIRVGEVKIEAEKVK